MATSQNTAPTGAPSPLHHIHAASERIAAAADIVYTAQRALEPDDSDKLSVSAYGALGHAHDMLRAADTSLDHARQGLLVEVPAGTPSRSFDSLLARMLDQVLHLRLADNFLRENFAELDAKYQPAAQVLHDATNALDALHTEFDQWGLDWDFTPRLRPASEQDGQGLPAILGRLNAMRAIAEGLHAEIQALHDSLPEDREVDEVLASLRVELGEMETDAQSIVNYLTPVADPDAGCAIYALQQRLAGAA